MAVELEVKLQDPIDSKTLVEQSQKELENICSGNIQFQSFEGAITEGIRLVVGETAEVDVTYHGDPSLENIKWAVVSFSPLRTPESKLLCLVVSVAIARLSGSEILDDSLIFGSSSKISSEILSEKIFHSKSNLSFSEKAKYLFKSLSQ